MEQGRPVSCSRDHYFLALILVDLLRLVEVRHHHAKRASDHRGVVLFQGGFQHGQLASQLFLRHRRLALHKDLVVLGLFNVPAGHQQLLIELLAGRRPVSMMSMSR